MTKQANNKSILCLLFKTSFILKVASFFCRTPWAIGLFGGQRDRIREQTHTVQGKQL